MSAIPFFDSLGGIVALWPEGAAFEVEALHAGLDPGALLQFIVVDFRIGAAERTRKRHNQAWLEQPAISGFVKVSR
jgi:hypothetical protein